MPTQWSEAEQVPLGYIAPPRPQARNPLASLGEGGGAKRRRERYATAAPQHQAKRDIPRPGAGYFCPRRQKYPKTPPKTTFLDFLTRLRLLLISLVFPRERRAMQTSPKCCIVSASWSAAAFALKCRAVQAWQEHFLNSGPWPPPTPKSARPYRRQKRFSNSGLWPPPTFAALRQRRDLIIA